MITLSGKYNTANVYTDVIDENAISQIIELLNQPFTAGQKIAIMPDVHAGAGCVIGTTMTITDKVVPNLVGVDIGCGMKTVQLHQKDIDLKELDEIIRNYIPSGFDIRKDAHPFAKTFADHINLENLRCHKSINIKRAYNSIGTLGGGNHFIEVDKDEEGNLYLIVHSGSRHLGVEVAKYYQEKAYEMLSKPNKEETKAIVEKLKSENRQSEIRQTLAAYHDSKPCVPKALAYCEGSLFEDYIHDMEIVQKFAAVNREAMIAEILTRMRLSPVNAFTTIHNYIDTENMILRKGSVSAQAGERLLIPINMRDGSLICIGKGNPDYNFSAPHGAGRLYSRAQARASFTVEDYAKEMNGIYTTSVNSSTLDECPMAYKSLSDITDNITDTVDIVARITPIYNFKAGEA